MVVVLLEYILYNDVNKKIFTTKIHLYINKYIIKKYYECSKYSLSDICECGRERVCVIILVYASRLNINSVLLAICAS